MMDLQQVLSSLERADAAGDTQSAQALADLARSLMAGQEPVAAPPASKQRTWGEAATDVGAGLVSGAGSLVQLPGQLYGLATGDFSDTGALGIGNALQKRGEAMKSPGLKAREEARGQAIQEAEKSGQLSAYKTAALETLKDPGLMLGAVAENVPSLLLPGGVAKGAASMAIRGVGAGLEGAAKEAAIAAAKEAAIKSGTRAALGAGAVQQGADVGAQAYKDLYDKLIAQKLPPEEAASRALNLARAAGASGAVISLLANNLPGAQAIEKSLAGAKGTAGRVAGAGKAFLGEGLGESVEEGGGKLAQNVAMRQVDPNQSLMQGVGATAGQAAVSGAGLGGITGAMSNRAPTPTAAPAPDTTSPVTGTRTHTTAGKTVTTTTHKDGSQYEDGVQVTPPTTQEAPRSKISLDLPEPIQNYADVFAEKIELENAPQTPETAARIAELDKQLETLSTETEALGEEAPAAPPAATTEAPPAAPVTPPAATTEAPPAPAPVAGGAHVQPITAEEIGHIGASMSKKNRQWLVDNVQGKTPVEIQAMVQADPTLLTFNKGIGNALNEITQIVELENRNASPTLPEVQPTLRARGRKPSVGVPVQPAVAAEPAGAAPATGAPTEPVGQRLVSPQQPTGAGAAQQRKQPGALNAPPINTAPAAVAPAVEPKAAPVAAAPKVDPAEVARKQEAEAVAARLAELEKASAQAKAAPKQRKVVPVRGEPQSWSDFVESAKEQADQEMAAEKPGKGVADVSQYEGFTPGTFPKAAGPSETLPVILSDLAEAKRKRETEKQQRAEEADAKKAEVAAKKAEKAGTATKAERAEAETVGQDEKSKKRAGAVDVVHKALEIVGALNEIITGKFPEGVKTDAKRHLKEISRASNAGESPEGSLEPAYNFLVKQASTRRYAKATPRTRISDADAATMARAIDGKSVLEAADWATKNLPNADYKEIAGRVAATLRELQKAGVRMGKLEVTAEGTRLRGMLGVTTYTAPKAGVASEVRIVLNNHKVGDASGMHPEILLHELIHAATIATLRAGSWVSAKGTKIGTIATDIRKLHRAVATHFNERITAHLKTGAEITAFEKEFYERKTNAMTDEHELLSWSLTNREMQEYMESIPYKNTTAWDRFTTLIRDMLGLPANKDTALSEILRIGGELTSLQAIDLAETNTATGAKMMQQGPQDPELTDIYKRMGRGLTEPDTRSYADQAKEALQGAADKLKTTNGKGPIQRIVDAAADMLDASEPLMRRIREEVRASLPEDMANKLLVALGMSQASHDSGLSTTAILDGGISYDDVTSKFKTEDSKYNLKALGATYQKMMANYGMTLAVAREITSDALESKRMLALFKMQDRLVAQADALTADSKTETDPLKAAGKRKAAATLRAKAKAYDFHMTREEAEAGIELYAKYPEIQEVDDIKQGMRKWLRTFLEETGVWSPETGQWMLDNAEWVPFQREATEEETDKVGFTEYIRGLQAKAKEHQFKGSKRDVHDVMDNFENWAAYSVSRGIKNQKATVIAQAAVKYLPDTEAKAVVHFNPKHADRTVSYLDKGSPKYVEFDSAAKAQLFKGSPLMAKSGLPVIGGMIDSLNSVFRGTVVNFPLFPVYQLAMDSISATYLSGLKPRYAFQIPLTAVSEAIKTLRGTSAAHKELRKFGAVGVHDYDATLSRTNADVEAGLKSLGNWGKYKSVMQNINMASDNAVRQAVYLAAKDSGLSDAAAVEKAFEIINFRTRVGNTQLAAAARNVVFLNSFYAASRVALKVLSSEGISPTERKQARNTLISNLAWIAGASTLLALMNTGDEDYEKMSRQEQASKLTMPGLHGWGIPLRPDVFMLVKLLAETTVRQFSDKYADDPAKLRATLSEGITSAIISGPIPISQPVKVAIELATNYDFFTGRAIVGSGLEKREGAAQFSAGTSELAKGIGQGTKNLAEMVGLENYFKGLSPVKVDHFIQGMMGMYGGAVVMVTNNLVNERPSQSLQDFIASWPGMGRVGVKEFDSQIKTDFYNLAGKVSEAVATANALQASGRGPELRAYRESHRHLLKYQGFVQNIEQSLGLLRAQIGRVTDNKTMTADEKRDKIHSIKLQEQRMMANREAAIKKARTEALNTPSKP